MKQILTRADIMAARTERGAWTKATLASWGVPWPPPKGWIDRLTGASSTLPESHPRNWTFSTDSGSGAQNSAKRFHTADEAAKAAGEWLLVCAQNRFYPSVQIGTISE